ncbi:MAG: TonB-dependent receptor [Acidobacteriota bacterium]|nr:TonB-dependent receptor [Acidobacteriota bacterium]
MRRILPLVVLLSISLSTPAQNAATRTVSGVVISQQNELVPGVTIVARARSGEEHRTVSDEEGAFRLTVPNEPLTLNFEGKNVTPLQRDIAPGEAANNLQVKVELAVPSVHESVVIVSSVADPSIERRNDTVYREGLFLRDDQVFHTLDAGINAGQHEGGGKSLEVRRFGFNMDHGGLFGGLKVLVDDVQQNQATQGHGQGYLGALKSLTPELIADVDILNGPFSAEYGDFTGLGVVHIRTKESLPDVLTARVQAGSFDTFRSFLAYSPTLDRASAFVAYEVSRTDGPFISPLRYKRDNVTANYTRLLGDKSAIGFKLNAGRNDFFSSGQIPLDLVFARQLDRFGFIDPDNGGAVQSGTVGVYYRREGTRGDIFKVDGFLTRSLFDLWSNFTFFLSDQESGDEIQQHDSRLQQGANLQYVRPYKLFGATALLTVGGNFHAFQTNVGLYPSIARNPNRAFVSRVNLNDCVSNDNPDVPGLPDRLNTTCFLLTSAHARVTNTAGYVQQSLNLFRGRLHLEGGVRYDYFRFNVEDRIRPVFSGTEGAGRVQPKAGLAYTPSDRLPITLHFNYGRGISSQDARGVVQRPESPRVATTDFYQTGTSHNYKRLSVTTDLFLIDNSNQQVYIPDDGSIEFAGPSRAYGYEVKSSVRLTSHLAFNGGVTQVMNAFFRGTSPREYVDSAPHTVGNASFTLTGWRGFAGSLRYRHASNYRVDPLDAGIRASGLDVVDFYVSRRLRSFMDINLAVDNLLNKRYFETQNFFESRVRPGDDPKERIHATPGYPFGVTVGLTFRLGSK